MLRFIMGIIFGGILVVFALQNTDIVSVNFISWKLTLSRSIIVLATLGIGVLWGWILGGLSKKKNRVK